MRLKEPAWIKPDEKRPEIGMADAAAQMFIFCAAA